MAQHYKVVIACWGRYQQGSIIPEAAVRARGGDPDSLVARGVMKPTLEPRNCDLVGGNPDAKQPPDRASLSADVIRESNELRRENQSLRAECEVQKDLASGKERARKALEVELAKQVEEIDHLTRACETHQAAEEKALAAVKQLELRITALEAENARMLEEATAPASEITLAPLG